MPLLDDMDNRCPAAVGIGSWQIGGDSVPGVIAEIGVNHDGCVDRALGLIDGAREAGAAAAKFQVFRACELAGPDAPAARYQQQRASARSQQALLAGLELAQRDWQRIIEHCANVGILFLATPFGTEDVGRLVDWGVPALKIASTDIDHVPLLERAADTGLPLLVSTGASRMSEIDRAIEWLDERDARPRLVLLHCVSSYPTLPADACLARIGALRDRHRVWVGYSDHTTTWLAGALAVACGAVVLEKHLTHDPAAAGPDHACSLDAVALAEYVRQVNAAFEMMGRHRDGEAPCERDVRFVARKSIVARQAIVGGDRLTAEMLTCRRPANGLPPSDWHSVVGRVAACDIPSGTPLQSAMLRP